MQVAERGGSPGNVTAFNINMKVNLKMAGSNWHLAPTTNAPSVCDAWKRFTGIKEGSSAERWMCFGLTISKPQPQSLEKHGTPAVVSLAASVNSQHSSFLLASKVVQNPHMPSLVFVDLIKARLLTYFKQSNSHMPTHLLIYRDLINPTEYATLVTRELAMLRAAWRKVADEVQFDQSRTVDVDTSGRRVKRAADAKLRWAQIFVCTEVFKFWANMKRGRAKLDYRLDKIPKRQAKCHFKIARYKKQLEDDEVKDKSKAIAGIAKYERHLRVCDRRLEITKTMIAQGYEKMKLAEEGRIYVCEPTMANMLNAIGRMARGEEVEKKPVVGTTGARSWSNGATLSDDPSSATTDSTLVEAIRDPDEGKPIHKPLVGEPARKESMMVSFKQAFARISQLPYIVYVVAHKNHATRLYPVNDDDGAGRNLNVPAG
jgi:hypothetical protein